MLIMASSPAVLIRLVASAYSIAQKAGMIVRSVMAGGDLGIVEKTSSVDLQTKADRLVQMSICSSLAQKFPKLTIIGEEDLPVQEVDQELIEDGQWEEILKKPCPIQYSAIKEEDLVVWVDPLDGTKEYTEGLLDNVTVLIGIAYEGKAIAGVINQPYYNYQAGADAVLGRTIWGVLGLGAFGFQLNEVPDGKHIITTTRSHSNKLVNDCISAMNPDNVLRVGGAGNKIIQLIEGKASAYVFASPGCKKWDTCAPEVILCAVGDLVQVLLVLYHFGHSSKLLYRIFESVHNSTNSTLMPHFPHITSTICHFAFCSIRRSNTYEVVPQNCFNLHFSNHWQTD
ncbi:3'(2'),5'-bisphosphate nucleotidase 1 isoform X1 [Phascolarctos cinereus]|uniref:3'(2'),5'-bisphosphate nucleotidase 1 n=1 Tax=Phascolarctos cinereus TaxID=38626 RepID=A0A6P5JV17_PHACI|nr:3'(2'),5'-bisphosphate nucleotidase 1 isoform X2 [Phascolarctos cinereus]